MARTKVFSLFFLFVMSVAFVSGFFVGDVSGVSYYNWVHNPSFESYVNLIEDNGFESGLENQGQAYGNWSTEASSEITTQYANNGIWCAESNITNGAVWYNFTEPILGADVEAFSCYALCFGGSNDFRVRVFYSDDSYDYDDLTDAGSIWVFEDDLIDVIDTMKYVVAFNVEAISSYAYWFDDFVFAVDLTGSGEAQDEVSALTSPWFNLDYGDVFGFWFDVDSELTDDMAHTGNQSYLCVDDSFLWLYQYMGTYLDASTVHYVDCYVYTEDATGVGVNMTIVYTDGRVYYNYLTTSTTEAWVHLNFGQGWLPDSGYIGAVAVDVQGLTGGNDTYLDDVGVWASVPKDFSFFEWSISPNPLSYGGASFTQYEGVACTAYGYVYDDDGLLTDEGTFTVTDDFGSRDGVIVNGVFHFAITKRYVTADDSEHFAIVITLDDGTVMNVGFTAYWLDVGAGTADDDETVISQFMGFLPVIVLFFACCGLSVWMVGKFGLCLGIVLAGVLSYVFFPLVFPLYGLVAVILVDVALFIMAVKGAF